MITWVLIIVRIGGFQSIRKTLIDTSIKIYTYSVPSPSYKKNQILFINQYYSNIMK